LKITLVLWPEFRRSIGNLKGKVAPSVFVAIDKNIYRQVKRKNLNSQNTMKNHLEMTEFHGNVRPCIQAIQHVASAGMAS
jgi:hypothetical protein